MSVNLTSKQATTGITALLVIVIVVVLNFLVHVLVLVLLPI